jgi:MFS transporter, DHA1 family, multidrug resistance protein
VVQARGWRWTLWTALILTAVIYPLVLCTRETYEKTIMLRRERYNRAMNPSKALPKSSSLQAAKAIFSGNFVRPLHMLFTEPIVAAFGIYLLFILASFFLMIAAIPYVFYTVYGFDTRSQGLVFLSFVVGFLLASAMIIMLWHLVAKKAKNASTSFHAGFAAGARQNDQHPLACQPVLVWLVSSVPCALDKPSRCRWPTRC